MYTALSAAKIGNTVISAGMAMLQTPKVMSNKMLDIAYIAITLVFFWVSLLYVKAADRL